MLSHFILLPLLSMIVLAAPSKHLGSRAITIPGAYDSGTSLALISIKGATNSSDSRPSLYVSFIDGLRQSHNSTVDFTHYESMYCTVDLTNFTFIDGKPTLDLPGPNTFKPCEKRPTWQFAFAETNTGEGFNIILTHAITVNDGPTLVRTSKFNMPPLSNWTKVQYGQQRYNETTKRLQADLSYRYEIQTSLDLDRYFDVPTLTDNAPDGWKGDNYEIDPNATPAPYNRTADHDQRKQDQQRRIQGTPNGSSNPGNGTSPSVSAPCATCAIIMPGGSGLPNGTVGGI